MITNKLVLKNHIERFISTNISLGKQQTKIGIANFDAPNKLSSGLNIYTITFILLYITYCRSMYIWYIGSR